jgi:hypothetical protein
MIGRDAFKDIDEQDPVSKRGERERSEERPKNPYIGVLKNFRPPRRCKESKVT